MYRHNENQMILPSEFFMPFEGKLNPKNRWCRLASIIPWAEIEEKYIEKLGNTEVGQRAYPARMGLGALIIQNRKRISDIDTVEEITESPYLQYFIGLSGFSDKPPFDPSLMVHFRKRFTKDIINEINEMIASAAVVKQTKKGGAGDDDDGDGPQSGGGPGSSDKNEAPDQPEIRENAGKLILDATCAPVDVHYPTDLWLLNEAREATEEIVDTMHEPEVGTAKKPRTYREKARRQYLNIDKKKKKTTRAIRKAIGQQLRYIRRNLKTIGSMAGRGLLQHLSRRQYRNLLVIREIYRQQEEMYRSRTHQTDDRIVSIHMPFVRPIVRGKANSDVEFGPKLAISVVNGYTFMEHLSYDAFNEGTMLIDAAENYRKRFGTYPEAILADKIYRNRDNLQFCKRRNIRLSGPPLGRPPKDEDLLREMERQERKDIGERNAVEGKFGEAKRFYGLGRIMARLRETSEAVVAMQLLVMNLEKRLRILFVHFFWTIFRHLVFAA